MEAAPGRAGGWGAVVWVPALSRSGDDLLIVQRRVGHSQLFAPHLDQIPTASSHVGCCLVVLIFWNFIMVYTGSCAICTCAFLVPHPPTDGQIFLGCGVFTSLCSKRRVSSSAARATQDEQKSSNVTQTFIALKESGKKRLILKPTTISCFS